MPPPDKTCHSCGRRIQWRRKWERDWDQVRYCSQACRRRGVSAEDGRLEDAVRGLLAGRSRTASVPVGEVARTVFGEPDAGQEEAARRAARRLVAAGEVELLQRGRVVDPSTARGPFEIRRA